MQAGHRAELFSAGAGLHPFVSSKTPENENTASENSGGNGERYEFQEPDIQENENPGTTIEEEANTVTTPAEDAKVSLTVSNK